MEDDKTAPSAPALAPGAHPQGTIIAGRFKLESLAGRGGMGCVYRALDTSTGLPVALKLLEGANSPESVYRFNREAALLAELHHPAIVSYVAHGIPEVGQPYLAMEWLEGEDLAHRLKRKPLSLPETLALLRRATEGLATAHRQGIVHRDLKPSNLFLRGGRPEDVVLLDFGLARHAVPTLMGVTGSHTVLGTPGYMAPEQASSQPEIPPAADIFSLGCVLYECLTGKPPFKAPHFAAALAKILFAEPAPLHTLRAGLPVGLQVLVDRMLAKDPARRLHDADGLLEAIAALKSVPDLLPPSRELVLPPRGLVGAEQKLVSVLLVSLHAVAQSEETADWNQGVALRDSLRTALSPYGAQVALLADGSLVATMVPEGGSATDQAVLAARCALTFKERWPEAAVVLATGLGVVNERLPVGEAMDRAGRLLRQLERLPSSSGVVLDEVTAGLLGAGFQLSRLDSGTFVLQGEQLGADTSRPLLGKPTPCVGREQELALLDFTFTACVEESSARVLLVTAPPGVGKSRLRHEFLRRLEKREQPPLVLLGREDSMHAGASYGLLGQVVRRLCGIVEGQHLEVRRARLYQRAVLHLPEARAQEVVEFLGELCAIPFPEEHSARLRAARGDPRLMSEQVGRALTAFLRAECAHQPVLLVLEDVHWSDGLSIKLVDEVLRELADQPLMVLALARPEVKLLHPGLWARRLQELALHGLSRKAGARLVREVLGPQVPESVVHRTVEQADGNALFLEELIRRVAEGRGDGAPETVLAVLQSRLMRMEAGQRRVLLAASLFGRTFWRAGVEAMLGAHGEAEGLDAHLRQLVEQEVIEPRPEGHFSTEAEYRFRHALVRDAAYGMVPDSHRPVGHRLAGAWLERVGESDARVLATHYQLGQQLARAAHCYTRAAEQLFERNDLRGAMECAESALACGSSGDVSLRMRAIQGMVAFWWDQPWKALEIGGPALSGMKAGSSLWCRSVGWLIMAGAQAGGHEEAFRLCELLSRTTPEPEAIAAYIEAIALMGVVVSWSGARQKLEAILDRIQAVGAQSMRHDAMARGWMNLLKCYFLHFFEARPWQALKAAEQGWQDFNEIGSKRDVFMMQNQFGLALAALGDLPGALGMMREVVTATQREELHLSTVAAQSHLCLMLAGSSERAHRQEAHGLLLDILTQALVFEWRSDENSYSYRLGVHYAVLAQVTLGNGELLEAESHGRTACRLLTPLLTCSVFAHTVLSSTLLAQGRAAEARQVAESGVRALEQGGNLGVYAVASYLALAEACFAEGDATAGEAVLRKALECVRLRASDIPEAGARERFLRQVPENARTLELARQRWGDAAA
ncbi:serine/threonine-protein kinase PknK [Archangium gephyra]|uniref:serine/threonine-protein kinase n=1 Tax=Archangium gephyra TaxID=48 RepID=UPI0035D4695D